MWILANNGSCFLVTCHTPLNANYFIVLFGTLSAIQPGTHDQYMCCVCTCSMTLQQVNQGNRVKPREIKFETREADFGGWQVCLEFPGKLSERI